MLCDLEEEDAKHLFLGCPCTIVVWRFSPLRLNIQSLPYQDFAAVADHFFTSREPQIIKLFTMQAWDVWFARNGIVFQSHVFNLTPSKSVSMNSQFSFHSKKLTCPLLLTKISILKYDCKKT